MSCATRVLSTVAAVLMATVAPGTVLAQSEIAGQVIDTTDAVLPGATVEVASPALIEGSRVVFADSRGQYRIVELRPGPTA